MPRFLWVCQYKSLYNCTLRNKFNTNNSTNPKSVKPNPLVPFFRDFPVRKISLYFISSSNLFYPPTNKELFTILTVRFWLSSIHNFSVKCDFSKFVVRSWYKIVIIIQIKLSYLDINHAFFKWKYSYYIIVIGLNIEAQIYKSSKLN